MAILRAGWHLRLTAQKNKNPQKGQKRNRRDAKERIISSFLASWGEHLFFLKVQIPWIWTHPLPDMRSIYSHGYGTFISDALVMSP